MSKFHQTDLLDGDDPPSYRAATTSGGVLSGADIVNEVDFRRQELVRSAIESHIVPVLRRQALYGLNDAVIVLNPHDSSSLASEKAGDSSAHGEIIISPNEDNLTFAHLEGEGNSPQFWKQPAVLRELGRQLHAMLCASTIFEGVEFSKPRTRPEDGAAARGFRTWGRNLEVPLSHPAKNGDRVQLLVEREDVVMRMQNDFGLYETRTKRAVTL